MALPAITSLPDHVRRFLAEPRYAAVATIDEDGAPRQAVVWFLLDGDTIVVNSLDGRRWPTNLRRDPTDLDSHHRPRPTSPGSG